MSHARERAEKICLNCNAQLFGRFCHVCGQENLEPRESFWNLTTHFFNDITHFDGKLFKTVGTLIARPGFLPLEYINGRRATYLHPIRLYVFTSAIFFLILFNFYPITAANSPPEKKSANNANTQTDEPEYSSVAQYDSVQNTLPEQDRDGWIGQLIAKSNIERANKYRGRADMFVDSILENLMHMLPYLLFVSLPICAFFLKILYWRNKNNLYAGNAIFLVYLYVFQFIMYLVYLVINKTKKAYHMSWLSLLEVILAFYVLYYMAKAMKRYYREGKLATILKFIAFNILAFAAIFLLFLGFLMLSILKV